MSFIPPYASPATLRDAWPDRAAYRPGESASLRVTLANGTAAPVAVTLDVRLSLLDQVIDERRHEAEVPSGDVTVTIPFALPRETRRGYGIDITVCDAQGQAIGHGGTALDVLDDWTQAPRYGFLCDFAPGESPGSVETLSRYHVNVVQFYDWMWRHYELMPPHDSFTDGMGRQLSLRAVRDKVAACHERGMAALGYAAVYGAEPEYALEHPDEMLYDASGEPHSLEKLFYIMNIHQGNPWRDRILAAMARAVREAPFDGLHLDQYGFPKDNAFGPGPHPVPYDLAADFPPFIDDARRTVREVRAGSRVIFNAVDNWPIEAVAPTSQDATYIEVWPPYDTYGDLQALILNARRLAPEKQVILAAYVKPLQKATGDDLARAEAATRLASAAIWANGGFHLLMGEANAALCDPYYPAYAALRPDAARAMRRYYDVAVRYENALSDLDLVTPTGPDVESMVRVEGAPASPAARPGTVWTIARTRPGLIALSLINLTCAAHANWNAPQADPPPLHNLTVEVRVDGAVRGVFAASPDGETTAPLALPHGVIERDGATWARVRLPRLDYWSLLVVRTAAGVEDGGFGTSIANSRL